MEGMEVLLSILLFVGWILILLGIAWLGFRWLNRRDRRASE